MRTRSQNPEIRNQKQETTNINKPETSIPKYSKYGQNVFIMVKMEPKKSDGTK